MKASYHQATVPSTYEGETETDDDVDVIDLPNGKRVDVMNMTVDKIGAMLKKQKVTEVEIDEKVAKGWGIPAGTYSPDRMVKDITKAFTKMFNSIPSATGSRR